MSRVLLYIVRKYNRGEMPQQAYTLAHELMTMAWRNFTGLIPLPFEKKYLENGTVRQKMGRILLYVIQRYSAERARNYPEYAGAHAIEVTEPLIAQPHANGTLW